MAKTLFIWQEDFFKVEFFELEGDHSRFNEVYINSSENEELTTELHDLVYTADGKRKIEMLPGPTKDWTHFAVCGFVP